MNLKNYISDHLIYIITYIISNILIITLLNIFNINGVAKLLIITLIIIQIIPLIAKYIKENLFYKKLDKTLEKSNNRNNKKTKLSRRTTIMWLFIYNRQINDRKYK